MRENEFEKRVREKMDAWGFEPSESVWTGVEKQINQEKKRRVPLFWLFFISGLLLAGGAYYAVSNKNITGTIPDKNAENPIAKIPEKKNSNPKEMQQPDLTSSEAASNNNQHKKGSRQNFHLQPPVADVLPANKKAVHHTNAFGHGKKTTPDKRLSETGGKNDFTAKAAIAGAGDIVINNYSSQSVKTSVEKDNKSTTDSSAAKMISSGTQTKPKKDSLTAATNAKTNKQQKKSSGWKIGYTLGLGSSNLNQNLFNSVKTLNPVLNSNTFAAPPGNAGNNTSSEIRPGFSFDAGAFVTKSLSKRISFSAGINYHYYSTTIATGMKINTTLATYNNMGQAIRATSYYENGQSQHFTNQYHFIEVLLSANYQINKSKRIPLVWELGLTPGYIVSSNALYYDPNTNVYFKNYLQPNKWQVNGVTAFMIGIPVNMGQLQAGPQVQYGFTGFVHTNDGNSGHLFYAGLKISFIPGKK